MAKTFIVSKAAAVAFFTGLGFPKCDTWDDEKFMGRLSQVHEKIDPNEVPEKQKEFYDSLVQALAAGQDVVLDTKGADAEKGEENGKPEGKEKDSKATGKKPAKKGATKPASKPAADKPKAKAEKKSGKKAKAPKEVKPPKEKDEYGSVKGSTRSSINSVLSPKWQSDEEIQAAAGSTLRQARSQLRKLRKGKHVEMRRRIEYRLIEGKK